MKRKQLSTRGLSSQQEKAIAKDLNGQLVPNSGAGYFRKGDVVSDKLFIEAKTQMKPQQSFRVQKEWIDKAREESFGCGKHNWALCFNFGGEKAENFYIIDSETMQKLQEIL